MKQLDLTRRSAPFQGRLEDIILGDWVQLPGGAFVQVVGSGGMVEHNTDGTVTTILFVRLNGKTTALRFDCHKPLTIREGYCPGGCKWADALGIPEIIRFERLWAPEPFLAA